MNETGKVEIKRKLQRSELIAFFEKQESLHGRHGGLRRRASLGPHVDRTWTHVKLIAPEAVRPFVKKGKKNDAADAAAICEAASRPDVKFVPAKSLGAAGHAGLAFSSIAAGQAADDAGERHRGLATEFGLTVPKGIGRLDELMELVDADRGIPEKARQAFTGLLDHCHALAESIESIRSGDCRSRAAR